MYDRLKAGSSGVDRSRCHNHGENGIFPGWDRNWGMVWQRADHSRDYFSVDAYSCEKKGAPDRNYLPVRRAWHCGGMCGLKYERT